MSFIDLSQEDSVISSEVVVAPCWSGNVYTLTSFFTSSAQETGSGKFFLDVNQSSLVSSGSQVQFSIAYGHVSGSGSAPFNSQIEEYTPTRDIYGQFRSLIYGDENAAFNFGGSNGISKDIFVISVNRSRYKEAINLGSLNLKLTSGSYSVDLTDNSNDVSAVTYIGTNRVYSIVSGSNGRSYNNLSVQTNSGSYGLLIPDLGVVLLNPRALSLPYANGGITLPIDSTPSTSYTLPYSSNNSNLYRTINVGSNFSLKSEETISSKFISINVKFGQLNYTTNPSIIDNKGNLLYQSLIDNPQSYATTVGLYNETNELLAVAKLNKPLVKDNTKTLSIRTKLEF